MRRTRFTLSLYLAVGQCLVGSVIAAELPSCTARTDTSTFHTMATMVVTGHANERLYLRSRHPDACKSNPTDDCKPATYVITGNTVSVGDACTAWSFVRYHGTQRDYFGWVETDRLAYSHDESQISEATCTKGIDRKVDREQSIEPERIPAEVAKFVPSNKSVVELDCLEFNRLEFSRYFLVLTGDPLDLIILARQPDNSLKVEAQNADLLVSPAMGGMRGGYRGLDVLAKGFRINNDVGSAVGFGDSRFTFVFSSEQKTWVLEEAKVVSGGREGRAVVSVQTDSDFGVVTLIDFNGEPWGIGPP